MLHRPGGWWQQHGEECPADHGEIEETGAAAEDATAPQDGWNPSKKSGWGRGKPPGGSWPLGRHPRPWLCEVEGAGGGHRDRG